MVIHDLTPSECREVLGRVNHGRLGCSRADQPYVVPFFFYLDPDRDFLFSFSTLGQKIDWMRGNPKVCVEVDEVVDQFNWVTVLAFGRYQELGDSRQDEAERRRASELFQRRPAWWLPGVARATTGEEHHTPIVYRIRIDRLTGRRAGGRHQLS